MLSSLLFIFLLSLSLLPSFTHAQQCSSALYGNPVLADCNEALALMPPEDVVVRAMLPLPWVPPEFDGYPTTKIPRSWFFGRCKIRLQAATTFWDLETWQRVKQRTQGVVDGCVLGNGAARGEGGKNVLGRRWNLRVIVYEPGSQYDRDVSPTRASQAIAAAQGQGQADDEQEPGPELKAEEAEAAREEQTEGSGTTGTYCDSSRNTGCAPGFRCMKETVADPRTMFGVTSLSTVSTCISSFLG
ncbi:MAG: hypothetical protein M1827_004847 [Pycnora praestabilis]|nr:MAG: hypothetical protein M1827_004847 [Pycnora praestabilis]